MGERFVEVDRNLHKNSKGGVFQKSKRFCNLLFLQKMIFFVFPLDRNNIGCPKMPPFRLELSALHSSLCALRYALCSLRYFVMANFFRDDTRDQ
jgi:hypothetical protein